MRRVLALADALSVLLAILILETLDGAVGGSQTFGFPVVLVAPAVSVPAAVALWFVLSSFDGSYHVDDRRVEHSASIDLGRMLQLSAAWAWLLFVVQALASDGPVSVAPMVLLWALAVPLVVADRGLIRNQCESRGWYRQAVIIVGTAPDSRRVELLLGRHPEYGLDLVRMIELNDFARAGRIRSVIEEIQDAEVARVMFASSYEGLDESTGALRFLAEEGIQVDLVPGDSEVFRSDAALHFAEGLPVLTFSSTARSNTERFAKRSFDVAVSALAILLLSPLLAYCALRIRMTSSGPALFRQSRVGRNGTKFEVLKFRTMYEDADARKHDLDRLNERDDGMFKITDDPRITPFGAKLRRSSLDELPQLFNVLRGEMSLVGPRPLIDAEASLVADHYVTRFRIKPGITGPWQVLGRSDIPFDTMVKLDYAYVVGWSIGEDLRLLVRTASAMVHGRGAY